jgi:hypothetical protein
MAKADRSRMWEALRLGLGGGESCQGALLGCVSGEVCGKFGGFRLLFVAAVRKEGRMFVL